MARKLALQEYLGLGYKTRNRIGGIKGNKVRGRGGPAGGVREWMFVDVSSISWKAFL